MGPTTRTFQAASTRPVRSIGTLREELHFIDKRILTQLQPYDLCDRVLSKEPRIVGKGTFSDVFRGICRDTENRQVKVAMKRLRLHVNAEECKRVRVVFVIQPLTDIDCDTYSCSRRRSTCGQNSSTLTYSLSLDLLSTRIPGIPF